MLAGSAVFLHTTLHGDLTGHPPRTALPLWKQPLNPPVIEGFDIDVAYDRCEFKERATSKDAPLEDQYSCGLSDAMVPVTNDSLGGPPESAALHAARTVAGDGDDQRRQRQHGRAVPGDALVEGLLLVVAGQRDPAAARALRAERDGAEHRAARGAAAPALPPRPPAAGPPPPRRHHRPARARSCLASSTRRPPRTTATSSTAPSTPRACPSPSSPRSCRRSSRARAPRR